MAPASFAALALGLLGATGAPALGRGPGGRPRGSAPAAAGDPPRRPNVVLFMMDDVGWADVSHHGSNFPTPHMDALVAEGVELDRMYVNSQCSPTRAATLTGTYAHKLGLQHYSTIMFGSTAAIPKDAPTLAEELRAAGYATAMSGKWHLGYARPSNTPTGRGFDTAYGPLGGAVDYYSHRAAMCQATAPFADSGAPAELIDALPEYVSPWPANVAQCNADPRSGDTLDFIGVDGEPAYGTEGTYSEDLYIDRVERVVADHAAGAGADGTPLFLYFAEQAVHAPIQPPPQPEHLEACAGVGGGVGKLSRAGLCSMAHKMDDNLGRLVAALKAAGMYEDTLIWGVSDNGGMVGFSEDFLSDMGASVSSNWPLRGSKASLFDGGVRSVAFLGGGAVPRAARGSRSNLLAHAVDVLPTVLALAGAEPSAAEGRIDGRDIWAAATSGAADAQLEPPRTEVVLNVGVGGMVRSTLAQTGLARPDLATSGAMNMSAVIDWPWKLIVGVPSFAIQPADLGWWSIDDYAYTPPPQSEDPWADVRLFNLERDPAEAVELSRRHPGVVGRLRRRLRWHMSAQAGYRPVQENTPHPFANPRLWNNTMQPFLPDVEV